MSSTPTPEELKTNSQKAINDLLKGGGVKRTKDAQGNEVEAFEIGEVLKVVEKMETKADRTENGLFSYARFEAN